jgi:hypothetical protein
MNRKIITGAIVGGIIVFLYQFLSWSLINFHKGEQLYTANQDTILAFLEANLPAEGSYFLPIAPPDASMDDQQKMMENSAGKPWAQIQYHKSLNTNMGMAMTRGLITDIIAVFLVCLLLGMLQDKSMRNTVLVSIAMGVIGYLTTTYTNSIWFDFNSLPYLVDAILTWLFCGLWLGYWLNKP